MICLDTNYLIGGVQEGSPEADQIVDWYSRGEVIITLGPAWYEFLCGPVTQAQIETMGAFLSAVIPFSIIESREAAQLFNAAGRRRTLRFDSMIAATAIAARARLATNNLSDFVVFKDYGLELV